MKYRKDRKADTQAEPSAKLNSRFCLCTDINYDIHKLNFDD
jgi:hypothetical protein